MLFIIIFTFIIAGMALILSITAIVDIKEEIKNRKECSDVDFSYRKLDSNRIDMVMKNSERNRRAIMEISQHIKNLENNRNNN